MKFTIIFEIHPPGVFGVPENGRTVIPGPSVDFKGDKYHLQTVTRVEYGTLSKYRDDKDKINIEQIIGNNPITIKDNFATLVVEASKVEEACYNAINVIDCFLKHVSLSGRRLFSYKPILIMDDRGKNYIIPKNAVVGSVTVYNLEQLNTDIANSIKFFHISDPLLDKALQYYEHALFLFENRLEMADFSSRHFKYLIAAAFLNMWKALSTVIGDPSTDSDYQSRYKRLGFNYEFFKLKIEHVRDLRNDYDVAHYHIGDNRLKDLEQNFGMSKKIVASVLLAYRQHLADGKSSFAKPH